VTAEWRCEFELERFEFFGDFGDDFLASPKSMVVPG
jgi:hypothetical protein